MTFFLFEREQNRQQSDTKQRASSAVLPKICSIESRKNCYHVTAPPYLIDL